jgi:predicted transcriptional regulator of viral defense system
VAKLIPKGIVCLDSALAFHGLTDRIPSGVWVAIASREWRPRITHPPVHIVRFGPKVFNTGHREHLIERVTVRIYEPAKTVADLFVHAHRQHRWSGSKVGVSQALQGMKEALRQRKATPAEIVRYAEQSGIWKVAQPYLEALTVDAKAAAQCLAGPIAA